jgi:hypothetical protein
MKKRETPPGRQAKTSDAVLKETPIPQTDDLRSVDQSFPIGGIGASAGGLEALEIFLENVPVNCGMAFVIIQHLDPTRKGLMVELLQRSTPMPVLQVKDRVKVEPDCVYVIPPNRDLSILHGVLHLLEPMAPRGLRLPIDFFFRSLADDRQNSSIGVILSGMGSDGTLGLRAIKEKAGVVFVQAPATAKFDGMPRSAVDAGLADVIAPVEELPGRIFAYLQHAPLIVRDDRPLEGKTQSALEKEAFTGADTRQIGRFEIADGSTLCLDEIGELPLALQAKLLRAIQYSEFERLGSSKTIKVDVRIIATTHRDLGEAVRKGRFRQDLYYRLNVFPITVPPLRQRKEDIPLMVAAFIKRYSKKMGKPITSIAKTAMKTLEDYPWPGNVRELESVIERAVILSPGPVLQLTDKLKLVSPSLPADGQTLEATERNQILRVLSETRWPIEGKGGAAAILGIHPSTLRARMHKLEIIRR